MARQLTAVRCVDGSPEDPCGNPPYLKDRCQEHLPAYCLTLLMEAKAKCTEAKDEIRDLFVQDRQPREKIFSGPNVKPNLIELDLERALQDGRVEDFIEQFDKLSISLEHWQAESLLGRAKWLDTQIGSSDREAHEMVSQAEEALRRKNQREESKRLSSMAIKRFLERMPMVLRMRELMKQNAPKATETKREEQAS